MQLKNELQSDIWSFFNQDSIRRWAPEQSFDNCQLRLNQKIDARATFDNVSIEIQLENVLQSKIWQLFHCNSIRKFAPKHKSKLFK